MKILEANAVSSSDYLNDILKVFKDVSIYENFRLHLKIFKLEKIRGTLVDIEKMLIELDSKYYNLVKSNG